MWVKERVMMKRTRRRKSDAGSVCLGGGRRQARQVSTLTLRPNEFTLSTIYDFLCGVCCMRVMMFSDGVDHDLMSE
jgi:hypothetical protein